MKINCNKCQNYYVTWDPRSPKGCKAYQFKSPTIPSQIVLNETGSPCQAFKEKITANDQKKILDLNDDKLW